MVIVCPVKNGSKKMLTLSIRMIAASLCISTLESRKHDVQLSWIYENGEGVRINQTKTFKWDSERDRKDGTGV
jgi:hypothetical protein